MLLSCNLLIVQAILTPKYFCLAGEKFNGELNCSKVSASWLNIKFTSKESPEEVQGQAKGSGKLLINPVLSSDIILGITVSSLQARIFASTFTSTLGREIGR